MLYTRVKAIAGSGLRIAAVAAGYYVAALVGTVLSVEPFGFAIIWPGTAFLIAILLVVPVRRWWIYLAGVVLAHFNLVAHFQPAPPFVVMLTQITGNIGLAAATVLAVRGIGDPPRFDTFRDVLRFALLAGVVLPALGNSLILGLHLLTGWTDTFWLPWRQWMLASIFPTITIPPVLAIAHAHEWSARTRPAQEAILELGVLSAALLALSFAAFGGDLRSEWWPALLLAPLPLLLWAAVRLGVSGVCFSLLLFASAIIAHALNDEGPFAVNASLEKMHSLQVFLIAIAAPLILLAALVSDRRRAEQLQKAAEARIRVVAAATDTGLWQWDHAERRLWMTDHCRAMLGLHTTVSVPEALLDAVHVDDRARVEAALVHMIASGEIETLEEFRTMRTDVGLRWLTVRAHTEFDKDGAPVRTSGVVRDITEHVNAQHEAESLSQRLLTVHEDEQRGIAQDLRDATAQDLVAVGLSLRALSRQPSLGQAARTALDEAIKAIYQTTNELRTFTFLLRPDGLDGLDGLCSVLQRYVEGFARRTGLKTTLRANSVSDRMPLDRLRALLRIAQESLTNVHRHAAASRVAVSVRCVAGIVHLVVSDDGKGMSLSAERKPVRSGLGISAMTTRVKQLNGRLAIRSGTGGTVVHAAIPTVPEMAGPDAPAASKPSSRTEGILARVKREQSEALASIEAHERSIAKLLASNEALDAEIVRLSSLPLKERS